MEKMEGSIWWIQVGLKNLFFLSKTARLMPPVTPTSFKRKPKMSYLVNLFRPEFILRTEVSLSPDAYSPFSKEGQQSVDDATGILFQQISEWAKLLDSMYNESPEIKNMILEMDIKTIFHAQGFNL